jgi:hypothetical protein
MAGVGGHGSQGQDQQSHSGASEGGSGAAGAGGGGGGAGGGYVEGMTAQGKYFRLEVPNFNDAAAEEERMSSFLHLGAVRDLSLAASTSAPRATGEDLAAEITSFIDDTRLRDGCPDFLSEGVRQAETAKLHTKGGWRDHSDGNRITTTRGDKIEVIKGNYKMVVLGRQNDHAEWDVSGGHISSSGITFEGASRVEYTTAEYGGTWKVFESVEKGDVTSTYYGKVRDTYWGEEITSTTGSASPTETRPNPVILDHTWALSIASYTGSASLPVPSIMDDTWAGTITSTTNAGTITDTTTAGAITSTTTAGAITDTTTAAVTSTTIGNVVDTTIGNSFSTIIGAETEVIIGNSMEINIGAQESFTLGAVLDVTIGLMVDIALAGGISIDIGPRIEFRMGNTIEFSPTHDKANPIETKVNGTSTTLSGTRAYVSALTSFT